MNNVAVWWKRIIIIGLCITVAAALMFLFPKKEKTVITFGMFAGNQWDVPNDDCYKIIDETIESFEKEYPDVEVEYVSGILKEDYSEWLSQQALKSKLPDVFLVLPEDFNTFASVGMLKNLDTMIEADSSFDPTEFYSGCYDAGEWEGKQYAFPYESVPKLMVVNKTLLEQENISLPDNNWTWEDFYEICRKVTKDTTGDGKIDQFGVYDYTWLDAVYSNGGNLFDAAGKNCRLSDSAVEKSILFARDIYHLSGNRNPTGEDFDMGKVAFRPMTFSEFRTYKPYPWKINKYFDFEWDCVRFPSGPDGENLTETETLLMGISAKSENSAVAWKFLKELTSNEKVQQKVFQYSKGVSPMKNVTTSRETQTLLEESVGADTVMKTSLLDELMQHAAKNEKIRNYTTILEYMDGEILKLIVRDEDFDSGMQKLKKSVDKMMKE